MITEAAKLTTIAAALLLVFYAYRKTGQSGDTPQDNNTMPSTPNPVTPVNPVNNTGTAPRGIRNNNPLNIEFNPANQWQGQTGTDGRFAIFSSPFYGIRAGGRLLKTYRDTHRLTTPRAIISRFAPAFENDVRAYLNSVTRRSGLAPDLTLNQSDYPRLVEAMIHHENGVQPYDMNLIQGAVNAGFE